MIKVGYQKLDKRQSKNIEELGILLDVSHLNEKSFWDLAKIASRPFVASHSNARKLANVKRNLDDKQLLEIAKSGGLVGINAIGPFVNDDENNRKMDNLIDHMDYMKNLIGIEHIAFGFDFCDFLSASSVGLTDTKQILFL